ncbi:MAG: type II toxin-antitoxin system RelE/ParE family toxin [Deltaproteobacteria bacterium]|nr:type II toxin-antitoxin system RelE/ParE family toxin [Deltaproteobacteria bacterium]
MRENTDDQVILLHAFIKKTQETPKKDINLAIERQKDFE